MIGGAVVRVMLGCARHREIRAVQLHGVSQGTGLSVRSTAQGLLRQFAGNGTKPSGVVDVSGVRDRISWDRRSNADIDTSKGETLASGD